MMLPKCVATFCYGNWLNDHVPRFLDLLYTSNPNVHVRLHILPSGNAQEDTHNLCELTRQYPGLTGFSCGRYFFPPKIDEGEPERYSDGVDMSLLIPDMARVHRSFSGRFVYMDPDIDVIGSLDPLFDDTQYTDCDIALCHDPSGMYGIAASRLSSKPVVSLNIGTVLFNPTLNWDTFKKRLAYWYRHSDSLTRTGFAIGSYIWNAALQVEVPGVSEPLPELSVLPYKFGTYLAHSSKTELREAVALHFSGPHCKKLRPLVTYEQFPDQLTLNLKDTRK